MAIELYGTPDDETIAGVLRRAGKGVRVAVRPHLLGGFTRSR
jgi:hypothetical protein